MVMTLKLIWVSLYNHDRHQNLKGWNLKYIKNQSPQTDNEFWINKIEGFNYSINTWHQDDLVITWMISVNFQWIGKYAHRPMIWLNESQCCASMWSKITHFGCRSICSYFFCSEIFWDLNAWMWIEITRFDCSSILIVLD